MSDMYFGNGGGNTQPTPQGQHAQVMREIRKLWKKLGEDRSQVIPPNEKAWSYSGIVAPIEDTPGQRWIAPTALSLVNVQLTLTAASATPYTVLFFVGFEQVATITIPAGSVDWLAGIGRTVDKGIGVQPRLLTAGGGTGEQLGIVLRWEPIRK
jgi:hypothetical protein